MTINVCHCDERVIERRRYYVLIKKESLQSFNNAADFPSTSKERINKNDKSDSRKIAYHLETEGLKGIYIPEDEYIGLRNLARQRLFLVRDSARIKNRIKSLLVYMGKEQLKERPWTKKHIDELKRITFKEERTKETLNIYIKLLKFIKEEINIVEDKLKNLLSQEEHLSTCYLT